MSQPLIELKELTKYFDISKTAKLHAVDGITLNINKGETLGVVGESAAESPPWDAQCCGFTNRPPARSSLTEKTSAIAVPTSWPRCAAICR